MPLTRIGVIFDGDDTLWETQPLYVAAKSRFFREMSYAGFPPHEVERRFESIDRANVSTFGFSKHRFPQSMWDTYSALCADYAMRFDDGKAAHFRSIGESVFQTTPPLFDGVLEVLSELQWLHMMLILATKGDPVIQQHKVEASGLAPYFDRIYVVPDKNTREFTRIVTECQLDVRGSWSIGNSVRADINPALAVGLNTIWIPNTTWDHEDEEPISNERFHRALSIKDVPLIIISRQR